MKFDIHIQELTDIKQKINGCRPCFSWIFFGSQGIGKSLSAKNLALEILDSKTDQHPDLKIIAPLDSKDGISIDQIREIKSFLSLKSAISTYKIVIIDSIDDVSYQGSNALLKILEEPTDNTFIFLISHNISKVMPTIRSRSQEVLFQNPTYAECKAIMYEKYGSNKNFDDSIIISGNIPGLACTYLDNNVIEDYYKMLGLIGNAYMSASDMKGFDSNIKYMQNLILRFLSLINKQQLGVNIIATSKEKEMLTKLAKSTDLHKIMTLWQKTLENYKNQDIYNLDIKTNLYLTLSELS